jgi:hypothetical protein
MVTIALQYYFMAFISLYIPRVCGPYLQESFVEKIRLQIILNINTTIAALRIALHKSCAPSYSVRTHIARCTTLRNSDLRMRMKITIIQHSSRHQAHFHFPYLSSIRPRLNRGDVGTTSLRHEACPRQYQRERGVIITEVNSGFYSSFKEAEGITNR